MEKEGLVNKTEMGKKILKNFQQTTGSQDYGLHCHTGSNCHEHIVVDRYTVLRVEQQPQYYGNCKTFQSTGHAAPINPVIGESHKKESGIQVQRYRDSIFSICYLIIVIKRSVHALRVLPSPAPAQYPPFLMDQR